MLFGVFPARNTLGTTSPTEMVLLPTAGDTLPASTASIYVPAGYTLDLTLPAGTRIGTLISLPAAVSGDLVAADPTAFTTDPCAPGTHAAVWTASLTIAGQQVVVPFFLDPTTGDEAARGAYRITFCQTSILLLVIEAGLTSPATPGIYTWRALVTPPAVNGTPPDPSSVYELRAIVALPHVLKMKATYVSSSQTLVVSGKVTAAAAPEASADVLIEKQTGTKIAKFGSVTAKADGTFTLKKRVRETTRAQTFSLVAVGEGPSGPCVDPPLAPGGCLAQIPAPSGTVVLKVHIPKLPPKPRTKKH